MSARVTARIRVLLMTLSVALTALSLFGVVVMGSREETTELAPDSSLTGYRSDGAGRPTTPPSNTPPAPAPPAAEPEAAGVPAPSPSAPAKRSTTASKAPTPPAAAPRPAPAATGPSTLAAAGSPAEGYLFGAHSVWRTDVSQAPTAPNSAGMVDLLVSTVTDRYGGVAAFNAHSYGVGYYVAAPGAPTVDVAFHDCQGKGHVPEGLLGPGGQFEDVPIPAGAVPADGTDGTLAVYSPQTDTLWEFWVARQDARGDWQACWGGRMEGVAASLGFFSDNFGVSASGLSVAGGMISLADVRAGSIAHAMSLHIPGPAAYPQLSWPAQRTDGNNHHPDALPEGTRLRLDPSIDVASLGLHPVAAIVAEAAQRYGFIVVDQAGAVAVVTESGAAEQAATGVDPWDALLGGTPDYLVMQDFPWDRLQVLPQDHGRP